ncbi:MAG: dephospho-CoA kinase [Limnobacter sp.]|nr:dephospho-CoA kinase [Limnobacter sp.]
MTNKPLVVGLTGGIGSGKTKVSDALAKLGAQVLDADVLAHELCSPNGAAIPAIRQEFGPQAIAADGSMDRNHIRKLVFDKPELRLALEKILHPLIRQRIVDEIQISTSPYCVLVIPLLAEKGGWGHLTDVVVVVDCETRTQIERVKARNGWPDSQIEQVLAAQATREQRLKIADFVVKNNGTSEELLLQAQALHEKLLLIAAEAKE